LKICLHVASTQTAKDQLRPRSQKMASHQAYKA